MEISLVTPLFTIMSLHNICDLDILMAGRIEILFKKRQYNHLSMLGLKLIRVNKGAPEAGFTKAMLLWNTCN